MRKETFLLFLILILASVIRLYQITNIPQGFQVDEVSFGYNAYSLLKTGADEYGRRLPFNLRSFNDYKAAIYSYIDIPFVAIFGLNEFAVRLPSAVFGIIFVWLSYLLAKELTRRKDVALICASLVAISPTLIFLSRVQSDPNISMFFVVLGVFLFVRWTNNKDKRFLLGSMVFWVLSLFTYQAPRIFLILFVPLLLYFYKDVINKKIRRSLILFCIILFALSSYLLIVGGARYSQTSVLNDPGIPLLIREAHIEGRNASPVITRLFQNKPVFYIRSIIDNYFSYLNPSYLFIQARYPLRESVQNTGFIYLVELPFILIGIYQIIRRRLRWGYLLVGWFVLTPLALSPFVMESPNLHRSILFAFPLELIGAFGIVEVLNKLRSEKKIYPFAKILIVVLYTGSLLYFLDNLFIHQPTHKPWNRDHPYKKLMVDLKKYEDKYKEIIVPTTEANSYIFYLFFNKIDPKKYQESGSHGNEKYNKIGKYTFSHVECPLGTEVNGGVKGERGILYVNNGLCIPPQFDSKIIEEIKWGDDTTAFRLQEYAP